eukprot:44796_1
MTATIMHIFLSLNGLILVATSFNLNMDVYGHRGGMTRLVPEHSMASFTLGAQEGATYLEPDIVLSSDGKLIVNHDLGLTHTTNIASHPEFADRNKTIEWWYRGNPNNYTNNQPASIHNFGITETGWFAFDFTLQELQTLTRTSRLYETNSPLNDIFYMMSFDELLQLINNLSIILNRPIGVIPELKRSVYLESLGFENIELLLLESLEQYGFVYYDENDGYYKSYQMYDEVSGGNKSKVILQSFTQESLHKFKTLTNGNIPNMFLFDSTDFNDELEYGLNKSVVEWALGFSQILGCSKTKVQNLVDLKNDYALEYDIGTYTMVENISEYIKFIDDGLIGVFSDDVATGRVVKHLLTALVNDKNGNSTISSFCNVNNDKTVAIEWQYILIAAIVALVFGVFIGGFITYYWIKKK